MLAQRETQEFGVGTRVSNATFQTTLGAIFVTFCALAIVWISGGLSTLNNMHMPPFLHLRRCWIAPPLFVCIVYAMTCSTLDFICLAISLDVNHLTSRVPRLSLNLWDMACVLDLTPESDLWILPHNRLWEDFGLRRPRHQHDPEIGHFSPWRRPFVFGVVTNPRTGHTDRGLLQKGSVEHHLPPLPSVVMHDPPFPC